MPREREKGYWVKRQERYAGSEEARTRAGALRLHDHVSHVRVRPAAGGFEVAFSVAKWYLDQLQQAGGTL
jgi:hypothetical protein